MEVVGGEKLLAACLANLNATHFMLFSLGGHERRYLYCTAAEEQVGGSRLGDEA